MKMFGYLGGPGPIYDELMEASMISLGSNLVHIYHLTYINETI